MSARDELAGIIQREYVRAIDRKRVSDCYDAPADAILAAGYRKPRIITTAEEVDALPERTVVMTCYGDGVTIYRENTEIPSEHYHFLIEGGMSATVLHEPEPSGE